MILHTIYEVKKLGFLPFLTFGNGELFNVMLVFARFRDGVGTDGCGFESMCNTCNALVRFPHPGRNFT
jgi:hypothetical protein